MKMKERQILKEISVFITVYLDFEGSANVKRIEIQWLKDAMPKRVDFLVNEKIVATSILDDSSREFNNK